MNQLLSLDTGTKKGLGFTLGLSGLVIVGMMILGLLMLLAQGNVISVSPAFFYEIMTLHGTGMIGAAALASSCIMWYFLSQYVKLNKGIFFTYLTLVLIGVATVITSIFVFNFAGGWTFLFPLPSLSGGAWGINGAALFLIGMLVIGCGFLLLYLETSRAIIKEYGSFGNSLGWPQITGKVKGYGPSATVVASTMVSIVNLVSLTAGATILVMMLINLFSPGFTIDPLLAKNFIYAFGHIFANSIIYMAVIAVYELLPRYTNRPWKSNKIFLIAWNCSTLFTIIIYPHHLLMDSVMPKWMLLIGQILSYMNGIPVLVVTAFGAMMIIFRSGIEWDMVSSLLILSMFGWVIGVVPAIIDATIVVNHVMHNTKWVPGHFHLYMGLGACAMIIAFMYYLTKVESNRKDNSWDTFGFWSFILFFLALAGSFLYSGKIGAPRRWAEHLPQWVPYDQLGAIFGTVIVIATSLFLIRFISYASKIGAHKEENTENNDTDSSLYA